MLASNSTSEKRPCKHCTTDGECYVVKAGPEFKVLGKNSLDDMCMATPATVRGNIVLRTLTKLYRIEEKGP